MIFLLKFLYNLGFTATHNHSKPPEHIKIYMLRHPDIQVYTITYNYIKLHKIT